jgi:cell division protease FtsH
MSIIPRGQALGVTVMLPQEDRLSLTKDNAEGFIIYAMGGRAAEALVFKRQTTGAGDDIRKATQIAHNMVCKWGMSDVVGPISIGKDHDEVFLGRELQQSQAYSDRLRQDIDEEVHRIVNTCYERALKILEEHKVHLLKLADALIIKETVTGDEINRILLGEDVVADEERRSYESRKANSGKLQPAAAESAKAETRPSERAAAKTSLSALPQGT